MEGQGQQPPSAGKVSQVPPPAVHRARVPGGLWQARSPAPLPRASCAPCLCEAELSTVHRSGDLFRIAAMTAVEILWLAAVPAIYFALLMLGRWLKHRWGVKVGWAYQLFCVSSALFVPLSALDAPEALVLGLETALVLFGTLVVLALIQRGVWELYKMASRSRCW